MMIFGIAVTAVVSGKFLDPFSLARLIDVTAVAGAAALALTVLAVYGVEKSGAAAERIRRPGAIRFVP